MLLIVGLKALVFAIGVIWCKEVFERRHDDIDVLRTGDDRMQQGIIVGFWVLTVFVALGVGWMAVAAVTQIVHGLRGL